MKIIIVFLILILISFAVILPNAANYQLILSLLVVAALSLAYIPRKFYSSAVFKLLIIFDLAVFNYTILGIINGAQFIAAQQTLATYVVSFSSWVIMSAFLFYNCDNRKLITFVIAFSGVACILLNIFLVKLFLSSPIDASSLSLSLGYSADFNYNKVDTEIGGNPVGSLIFVIPFLLSVINLSFSYLDRFTLSLSLLGISLWCGRAAVVLSAVSFYVLMTLSLLFGVLLKSKISYKSISTSFYLRFLTFGGHRFMLSFFVLFISIMIFNDLGSFGFDSLGSLLHLHQRFLELPIDERSIQTDFLIDGSISRFFMGSGFGVGVNYIRSNDYPWRYEAILPATLFRVGLPLSLFMLYCLLMPLKSFKLLVSSKSLDMLDFSLFAGYIGSLVAINTNPYLESASFQVFYVLPSVFLMLKSQHGHYLANGSALRSPERAATRPRAD